MPPEARARDRWVAAAMIATIAFLVLLAAPLGRALAAEPDRYLLRGDLAAAAWTIDSGGATTFIDVVATDAWMQHDQGADHFTKYDYVTVFWDRVKTDAVTGWRTETSWEITASVDEALEFRRSLRGVRLNMPATATGQRCFYDPDGGGRCRSLGEAHVQIDLRWDRVGEVTRDPSRVHQVLEGVRMHEHARVLSAVPVVSGGITGEIDLVPNGLAPSQATIARIGVTSHVFAAETRSAGR